MLTNSVRRASLRLVTAALFITPATAFAQTTWYVDVTACPNPGAGSELDPFCQIQDGINAAADGDTVLVLPGTYNEAIDMLGRAITLRARDGAEATTIDGIGLGTSVITCVNGEGHGTVLDGFRVIHGKGTPDQSGAGFRRGGGMRVVGSGPTVRNCTFQYNEADTGAGMFNERSDTTVTNCTFTNNSVLPNLENGKGGGIFNSRSDTKVIACRFTSNEASFGAGIYNASTSRVTITDCVFERGTGDRGAGIYDDGHSTTTATNTTFIDNTALRGGGVYANTGTTILTGCTLKDNQAGYGGGAYAEFGKLLIDKCTFVRNNAGQWGGAVAGARRIRNSVFVGNGARHGGAVHTVNTLANCSLISNAAEYGGGLYLTDGASRISNSILTGNSASRNGPELFVQSDAEMSVVAFSNIEGSGGSDAWDPSMGIDAGGNVDIDPMYRRRPDHGGDGWGDDPDTPDVDEGVNDDFGDLTLASGSPCTDAGSNGLILFSTTDHAGNPRYMDDPAVADTGDGFFPIVDMGAFEVRASAGCGNGTCDGDESCETCSYDCTDCDGVLFVPDEYDSLVQAVLTAIDGNQIMVAPGTYYETFDFVGKTISLQSTSGPEMTIIDGSGYDRPVVNCSAGEGPDASMSGFTITGGTEATGSAMLISNCDLTVEQCTFRDNHGGGMKVVQSHSLVKNCAFVQNYRRLGGGGLDIYRATPTVLDCTFEDNVTDRAGGGIRSEHSRAIIMNSMFRLNSGHWGGGLSDTSGEPVVTNSTFAGNRALYEGGALRVGSSRLMMTNVLMVGNSAETGGAVHHEMGVYDAEVDSEFTNCTFVQNAAVNGAAIATDTPYPYPPVTMAVRNSILWNGTGQIWNNDNSAISISHSDVFGAGVGEGNLDADPLFVQWPDDGGDGWGDDPDTPDVDEGANDNYGDLRLQENSPCIDAGDNDAIAEIKTDLDGNPRIVNDVVDMGAYEFQPRAIEVRIDVRPGNDVNPVKLGSRGVLPIAILSSGSFDALTVDPSTVLVAGAGVALRGNDRRYVTVERDVNHDDLVDLVVHVETAGVEPEADTFKIALTAQTHDGTLIFGTETIRTVGR